MSKRVRKQTKQKEPNPVRAANKQWSVEDKKNLLKALKQYGHTDHHSISKMFPEKTLAAVRLMIHKIMQKARSTRRNERSGIDTWLRSGFFDDKSSPIPQALKFISLFENHPPPEESNGFDFRAAYDYLYRMSLGHPPLDLTPETASKLELLMKQVHTEVWPSSENDVVSYLGMLDRKKNALKCYPTMSKLESRRMIGPDLQ